MEKLLGCPFCGENPELEKETKFRSSWDGKYLKYPDVWVNIRCINKECSVSPKAFSTLNWRPVKRKAGEKKEDMILDIENIVEEKATLKWNTRK